MPKNARAQAADVMTARLVDALGAPDASAGLHYYAWTLGTERCEQLLHETLTLAESEDGEALWTRDGSRRRATAGIFFTLAKRALEHRP